MVRALFPALILAMPLLAAADEEVLICYNWGCGAEARAIFDVNDLARIRHLFDDAETPALERASIQLAVALMARIAGQRTPIRNDRGGNHDDEEVDGRMDCIDHARTTTRYLELIERLGLLRFHRVLSPIHRAPWLVNDHWAARIEEVDTEEQFVVDSWFFDNGAPPVIFTLPEWKRGASPDG